MPHDCMLLVIDIICLLFGAGQVGDGLIKAIKAGKR